MGRSGYSIPEKCPNCGAKVDRRRRRCTSCVWRWKRNRLSVNRLFQSSKGKLPRPEWDDYLPPAEWANAHKRGGL